MLSIINNQEDIHFKIKFPTELNTASVGLINEALEAQKGKKEKVKGKPATKKQSGATPTAGKEESKDTDKVDEEVFL